VGQERLAYCLVDTALREDVFRADELRRFAEDARAAGLDEPVTEASDGGVSGEPTRRVAATAFERHDEFPDAGRFAPCGPGFLPQRFDGVAPVTKRGGRSSSVTYRQRLDRHTGSGDVVG
jgi:hypothetical protein